MDHPKLQAQRGALAAAPWNFRHRPAFQRRNGTSSEEAPARSSHTTKDYEAFARDCVNLGNQANTPALRQRLLDMARQSAEKEVEVSSGAQTDEVLHSDFST
jgi:hypothetical protein